MADSQSYSESKEEWFARKTVLEIEIADYWGDWGVWSEVSALKSVLMRRPGPEIEQMTDPHFWRWLEAMDPEKARAQHDALAQLYRDHGVDVFYVENMRADRPNAMFMRDSVFMTPEGAILARHAIDVRRGEERFVAETLGKLGVPILKTVHGSGIFEGACAMWVDRQTVIIGTGVRANAEGARQVEETLRTIGVTDFIHFPIPYGHAHVDGLFNFIDHDLAMMFPWQTPYDLWEQLHEKGIEIIEAPSISEVRDRLALNFVAIGPRKLVVPHDVPHTIRLLEKHDVEVIPVDITELRKGWGALHCMTAFLKRQDPNPPLLA
jgi:N-dimethylarginine dimethylaminohydrolase